MNTAREKPIRHSLVEDTPTAPMINPRISSSQIAESANACSEPPHAHGSVAPAEAGVRHQTKPASFSQASHAQQIHECPRISAVLNTLNEARNIGNALRSIRTWVSEMIVMDMESDDETVQIARSLGARVFSFPRVINFDAARVAALERANCEWILLLDADEVIPFGLSRKLQEAASRNEADAYRIPRLNYFSGDVLPAAGWGPVQDLQLRFFRRGAVALNDILHAHIVPKTRARTINLSYTPETSIVHFNYRDSSQFVAKLNKYTSLTAFQRKESTRRKDTSMFWMPLLEFMDRYVRKSGFRAGWRGFYYSFMMAAYRMTLSVKIREIQSGLDDEQSAARYQEIAGEIIQQYESGEVRQS